LSLKVFSELALPFVVRKSNPKSMGRYSLKLAEVVLLAIAAVAQQSPKANDQSVEDPDVPVANPGRPTVSTPATLTPTGYFQFESGVLSAWRSPQFSSQTSANEVIKFAACRRIELLAGVEPVAHSVLDGPSSNDVGGVSLGVQGVLYPGEGVKPTIATSYFHSVYGGSAPDLDLGSPTNSALLLASADVGKFHYDTNLFFNEVVNGPLRRGQFGQSLSVSHPLTTRFGLSGEIWHFTQPFIRGNAIANLWALSYSASKDLVLDAGFDHGLTNTSTHWEIFAGFTYLLPRRLLGH
jgi:hypothetical protein